MLGYFTGWVKSDQLMVLDEKSRNHSVIKIHPPGTIHVCTKFDGNAQNTCWDISLKPKNVNLIVALQEKSGDTKEGRRHMGTWMSVQNFWDISIWIKLVDRPADRQTLPSLEHGSGMANMAKNDHYNKRNKREINWDRQLPFSKITLWHILYGCPCKQIVKPYVAHICN